VYVVKVMKSGHSLRISVPRLVQRHLGLAMGDLLAIELGEGGSFVAYKLDPEKVRRARASGNPAGAG
jgi:antitoxin component of MazEF toxin-antitoxin module